MDKALLHFSSVSLTHRIIDIDMHIIKGQWWGLLGPNGAGKSTLLSLAAALEEPSSGTIIFDGVPFSEVSLGAFAARRCLVSQSYRTEFSISVGETLSFFSDTQVIPALIEQHLDISRLDDKSFDRLSGGEKQRVHLARNLMQIWPAIALGNALVLLDEPLQQMDVKHQVSALKLIQAIQGFGNTIVMSHHDINQTLQHCSHACLIKAGKLFKQGLLGQVITLKNIEGLFSQTFKVLPDTVNSRQYFVPD